MSTNLKYHKQSNRIVIPSPYGGAPVEITVVAKLPQGAGDGFVNSGLANQQQHENFVDEYNEPSALIGKPFFAAEKKDLDDPSALYTFGIDTRDLVFHRHAGQRSIIGVSGQSGCFLKFSLCTPEQAKKDPLIFFQKMIVVKIPADSMFSLRFNGMVYHQFTPVNYQHKTFFAVSVHTNELGGLSGELLAKVRAGQTSIPLLTEPAPEKVLQLLDDKTFAYDEHTVELGCEYQ